MIRTWLIGAAPEADICLRKPDISSYHAELCNRDGAWWLRDLASSNGTWVGQTRLTGEWHVLQAADSLRFANSVSCSGGQLIDRLADPPLALQLSVGADAGNDIVLQYPQVSAHHLYVLVAGRRWVVVDRKSSNGSWLGEVRIGRADWPVDAALRFGPVQLERATIADKLAELRRQAAELSGHWVLGAADDCALVVQVPSVSAHHAEVQCQAGNWQIRDSSSTNGTFVADQPVGLQWCRLTPSDSIRLGSVEIPVAQMALAALRRPSPLLPDAATASSSVAPVSEQAAQRAVVQQPARSSSSPVAQPSPLRATPSAAASSVQEDVALPVTSHRSSGGSAWVLGVLTICIVAGAGMWWRSQAGADGGRDRPRPNPEPVPGPVVGEWEPAWPAFRARPRPADAPPDSATALATLGSAPQGTEGTRLSSDEADMLVESSTLRARHDASQYHGMDAKHFGGAPWDGEEKYGVAAGSLEADLIVPHLDQLPIRDQARRGTCAAFTSIGAVEQAVLTEKPELASIDLSEQRFYWLSKPECQSDGCPGGDEGSSFEVGLRASKSSSSPDIPLERDCPYRGTPGDTDTQVPQPASCKRGVVKVTRTQSVSSLQEVLNVLVQQRRPVLVGTTLSDNFMRPPANGIITAAGDASRTHNQHTDGHAYLLVGYKRLPDMPDEGGICFVVRNSWGRTWGRSGYACVTQRWLKQHEMHSGEVVTSVLLGGELRPPDPPPPPAPSQRNLSVKSPGNVWAEARLGQTGTTASLTFRLADGQMTKPLQLQLDNNRLLTQGKVVGQVLPSGSATLCSGRYVRACNLEINKPQGQLRVSLVSGQPQRTANFGHAAPDTAAPWLTIASLGDGRAIEVQPDVGNSTVRCRLGGADTGVGALELQLRSTDILLADRKIGSIDPAHLGLCTGEFQQACGVVVGGDGLDLVAW